MLAGRDRRMGELHGEDCRSWPYGIDFLYMSQQGGQIGLEVDGKPLATPLNIESPAYASDRQAWRQWRHWNLIKKFADVKLPAGVHVLTVRILTDGEMNLAYFDCHRSRN
jgi:hypothetical protein